MAFEARNLSDGFGRRFTYVRLSVTEVCNFRCTYCLPDGWKRSGPLTFLTPGEIANLAAGLAELGVSEALFPQIIKGALADHSHKTNPRLASEQDYLQMLQQSM